MNISKQKTILLVEDEPILALTDSKNLIEYGYKVIHAKTGQKAIDAADNIHDPIDLILMDINLGEKLDGTEIAKIILSKHEIPILFHSSYTDREVVEKTANISSYGYVVKNGITVLDASIKMAFRQHDMYLAAKKQEKIIGSTKSELEMYEKRYRRLFESAKDGILILNAESGMIVDVNPYLINRLGYSKEEFLHKKIWDISAFKKIDYAKQLFNELKEIEYVRYEDLPLETSTGEEIHVEFISNVYLVDNEKVAQCNIRDITERKKQDKILADELIKKQALLKEIQHRSKNSFAMITSLVRLNTTVTQSKETQNILEELTSRIRSISDLYTLLYETDNFFEVNLKTYCHKVIDSMSKFSDNISIQKKIDPIIVPTKNAATIGMIIVELLSNSIKYAFPNGAKGQICIELRQDESHYVLRVIDDGIGLPQDFNTEEITSLGLHLVNLMVSQLDGEIKFVNENGTKVIIGIPK
jgi:PAS domain S-box-containing protein